MGMTTARAYLDDSDGELVTAALFAYAAEEMRGGDRSEDMLRTLVVAEEMLREPCFKVDFFELWPPDRTRMREFASDYPAEDRKRLADWARKELGGLE